MQKIPKYNKINRHLLRFLICIAVLAISYFSINQNYIYPFAEETCDSLGPNNSSAGTVRHSTFHFELTKLLLYKSGFSLNDAEIIARYCALTDQSNPKNNYPYPFAINPSTTDTFPNWLQSIAGTERNNPHLNLFGENPGVFFHFALRNVNDTLMGPLIYSPFIYPQPANISYRQIPYFWRVPFSYSTDSVKNWAIYGIGIDGLPRGAADSVKYYDTLTSSYENVPKGSLMAFGILLHLIADSYSHEKCMVQDTIRSHPVNVSQECNVQWHHIEIPYNDTNYASSHIEKAAQQMWKIIREYKRIHPGVAGNPLWTADNNGFQDGDGIPDELEDTGNPNHNSTFMEKWKSPARINLNPQYDNIINHSDHTTLRIQLVEQQMPIGIINYSQHTLAGIILNNISPNPAFSFVKFNFSLKKRADVKFEIFDVLGRVVYNSELNFNQNSNIMEINVNSLSAGIYFYKLTALGNIITGKMVKF